MALNFCGLIEQQVSESAFCSFDIRRLLERGLHNVGGLEPDGELMAEAGVVSGREKRRVGRHHGDRAEIEIALAVPGFLFQFLDGARGGADGLPADAVVTGDDNAAANVFRRGKNIRQQIGLRFGIACIQHRRADSRREFFFFGERVVLLEKRDGLLRGHAFRVFGKRLRGDADRFHFVAARLKRGFGAAQHLEGVGDLLLVLGGIEIDERRDGSDLRFDGRGRSGFRGRSLLLSRRD